MNVYEKNGYKDRREYLESLAEENGIGMDVVELLADPLGESEDFDGLVSSVQDYAKFCFVAIAYEVK